MQFEGLCQVLVLLRDAFWWLCIELIRSSLHFPAHLALTTILHSVGWLLLSLTALSPGSLFSSGKLPLITDSISFCLQKLVKTQSSVNLCAKTLYSSQTTSVSPPEHLMKNLSQGVARASYSLKNDGPGTKGNKRPAGQEPCQPGPKPDKEVSHRDESLLQSSQIYRQACGDEADPRPRCEVDPQVKGSTTCNDNNHSQTQCRSLVTRQVWGGAGRSAHGPGSRSRGPCARLWLSWRSALLWRTSESSWSPTVSLDPWVGTQQEDPGRTGSTAGRISKHP